MCCKTPCAVARCNGCPETNWNAFSWQLDSPASVTSMMWGTVERRFYAFSKVMKYPGTCPCVWINYVGEEGRDTGGVYNAAGDWYNIASSWILNRELVSGVWTWKLRCYRYSWDWTYYSSLYGYGVGWGWDENGPGVFGGCQDGLGDAAYGYPGYGYGWGGYGWGFGFDPAYWSIGAGMANEYILQGSFACNGVNRFVRDDTNLIAEPLYIPDSWPAFVDITRVALMRRVPQT